MYLSLILRLLIKSTSFILWVSSIIIILQLLTLSFKNSIAFSEERVEALFLKKECGLGPSINKKSKSVENRI